MAQELNEGIALFKQLLCCYNNIDENELNKKVGNDIYKLIDMSSDINCITTCNILKCKEILSKLKLILIKLPAVDPLLPIHKKDRKELLLAREVLEKGVIISIRDKDIKSFNIYTAQLFIYYFDYKNILPRSKKQNGILGTYLLYLLASNSIGDFHMTLEIIPIDDHNDKYIKYVLELEQHVMDGYFHYVLSRKDEIPLYLYSLFMDQLYSTIRYKLMDCLLASSNYISLHHICELLKFNSSNDFYQFMAGYNENRRGQGEEDITWSLENNKIYFNNQSIHSQELPAIEILNNIIGYATELERIV